MTTSTPTRQQQLLSQSQQQQKQQQNQLFNKSGVAGTMSQTTVPITPGTNGISTDLADRGRERKRTTIFGTLRKRLSRSKQRNGSAERDAGGAVPTNGFADSRSISADRLHQQQLQAQRQQQQQQQPFKQQHLGPLQQQQTSKFSHLASPSNISLGLPNLSRRSSLSETSGISGLSSASTKTFLHEASSLVLEVIENGVKRFVPDPYTIPSNH
jgi:hypothetical protein